MRPHHQPATTQAAAMATYAHTGQSPAHSDESGARESPKSKVCKPQKHAHPSALTQRTSTSDAAGAVVATGDAVAPVAAALGTHLALAAALVTGGARQATDTATRRVRECVQCTRRPGKPQPTHLSAVWQRLSPPQNSQLRPVQSASELQLSLQYGSGRTTCVSSNDTCQWHHFGASSLTHSHAFPRPRKSEGAHKTGSYTRLQAGAAVQNARTASVALGADLRYHTGFAATGGAHSAATRAASTTRTV